MARNPEPPGAPLYTMPRGDNLDASASAHVQLGARVTVEQRQAETRRIDELRQLSRPERRTWRPPAAIV